MINARVTHPASKNLNKVRTCCSNRWARVSGGKDVETVYSNVVGEGRRMEKWVWGGGMATFLDMSGKEFGLSSGSGWMGREKLAGNTYISVPVGCKQVKDNYPPREA